jgi:hypothetical protein
MLRIFFYILISVCLSTQALSNEGSISQRIYIKTKALEIKNELQNEIIEELGGVVLIDMSLEGVVDKSNIFRFEQEGYSDYRYKYWLDGVKDYLTSDAAIRIGEKIKSDYCKLNTKNERTTFLLKNIAFRRIRNYPRFERTFNSL